MKFNPNSKINFKLHRTASSAIGILTVTMIWGQNLTNSHHLHKPNPYVKLNLTDSKLPSKQTNVRKNNLNPEWNEVFKILVMDLDAQALQIRFGTRRHHNLGTNLIPLKELIPDEPKIVTLDLLNEAQSKKNGGKIIVNLNYKPFKDGECLPIELDEEEMSASETAHRGVPSGSYFKRRGEKNRGCKKKKDPKWDQEFEFSCEEPPINDRMHVEVLSEPPKKGLIYCKESLGYVDISLADVVKNKRTKATYRLSNSKSGQIQIEMQWRAQ